MSEQEDRKLLREILRSQTVDALVKQGFSRVEAEMISKKDDVNKEDDEKEEKKEKDVLKRISIEISVDDV
jgi:hypothetical protein